MVFSITADHILYAVCSMIYKTETEKLPFYIQNFYL